MRSRIEPGLDARLAAEPSVRAALRRAAREVADDAESLTQPPHHPIAVVEHGRAARVLNTSPEAVAEEWGSASREPSAPLRRGVKAAGLRLDEAP